VSPAANAGEIQAVPVRTAVVLDGHGSFEANGDPLSFRWSLVSKLGTSLTELDTSTLATPHFVADEPGVYLLSLVAHDGLAPSAPNSVTIMALAEPPLINQSLGTSTDALNALAPAVFKSAGLRPAAANKIMAMLEQIEQGRVREALDTLKHGITPKMNGCAEGGAPDSDDGIGDSAAQAQVPPATNEAIEFLKHLR
jgi:hypothetical protein